MRNFRCNSCDNVVYFRNIKCLSCDHALGFDPLAMQVVAVEQADDGSHKICGDKSARSVAFCSNRTYGVCNWLAEPDATDGLCIACQLNRTIPNLDEPGNILAWQKLEQAKKRLIYSFLRFGLPLDMSKLGKDAMAFDFISAASTGHLDGVITIDIRETDAVQLARQKEQFNEPYRALLGHLRHESGHYYWNVLIENSPYIDEFRALFGDERADYGECLKRHHANGPPDDWQNTFVTAYATMHPWEDWAETWAHYLHIVDAIDTAESEGMEPRAKGLNFGALWPFRSYDLYRDGTFFQLMERWFPLTLAINSLARSLGQEDFYPFIIPPAAHQKLEFIHRVIREQAPVLAKNEALATAQT